MGKEQVKPLFPLKHDFVKSLERYTHKAGMLADAVQTLIDLNALTAKAADTLRPLLKEFDEARNGTT